MKGIFGKVLLIDLTNKTTKQINLDNNIYKNFLGGYGLGIRLLFEYLSPKIDPLSEENILGFFPGFLTGTGFPMTGRWMGVSKSPLTGLWNDSNCGGRCGPEMKKAGFDGYLFVGKANLPVYITIFDDCIDFHDANKLWGKKTDETHQILKKKYPKGKPVYIGPAGENIVRYASIIDDRFRAAARGGLGAVMGSKKLKAVIFQGSNEVEIADPKKFSTLSKKYRNFLRKKPSWINRQPIKLLGSFTPFLRRIKFHFKPSPIIRSEMLIHMQKSYGSCVATHLSTQIGDAPIKNWQGIAYIDFPAEKSIKISDDNVIRYKTTSYGCRNCYLRCGAKASIYGGKWKDNNVSKPEYEALASLGGLCLIDDVEFIIKANSLCDRLGMDVISTGAGIAFILECLEKKVIDKGLTKLELDWGNSQALYDLIESIGYRRDIGDLLAEGTARIAEKFGPKTQPYAIHIHGQELPMHDPRYDPSYGLAYLIDASPGRHMQNSLLLSQLPDVKDWLKIKSAKIPDRYDYYDLGVAQARISPYAHFANALGWCYFALIVSNFPSFREIIYTVTSIDYSLEDIFNTGERILTLRHLFNLREDATPKDFRLPERVIGIPPHDKGPLKGVTLDVKSLLEGYYNTLNWNPETGVPAKSKLDYLDLTKLWNSLQELLSKEEETNILLNLRKAKVNVEQASYMT